jgi:short-subunit dehydrogenase
MRIFILGGTRGMGLALAQAYLAAGHDVAIAGRDLGRLAAVQFAGNSVQLQRFQLDIQDCEAVASALNAFAKPTLDRLIVCAGCYVEGATAGLTAQATHMLLRTNVVGLAHALDIAAALMLPAGGGHLVVFASVAGLLKLDAKSTAYSASKGMVLALSDGYRVALAPFGIALTQIVPGYVDTAHLRELNAGSAARKPFLLSEQAAVAHCLRAIERRQARAVFPWQMRLLIGVLNVLPKPLRRWLLARRR